jgi:hypothetical protein
MRILPWLLVAWCLPALPGLGQLAVEVVVEQEQYLRDESLPIKVRITNRTGQSLRLGRDNEWLTLNVETVEGTVARVVTRLGQVPVTGEFTLESAQVATRQVDLTPWFEISEPGRYQVTATLKVQEWDQEIPSKPRTFEVVRGTKIWEQVFGVPTGTGPPESRRYTLQQANYRKQMGLYLRLTDSSDQHVFSVYSLGPLVSFSQTEAQIDKAGYLHVLFQGGARAFTCCVISPDGDLVLRQGYDYAASRPTLRSNDEGRIYVAGGARRLHPSDIPTPSFVNARTSAVAIASQTTNAVSNPATNAPGKKGKKPSKE